MSGPLRCLLGFCLVLVVLQQVLEGSGPADMGRVLKKTGSMAAISSKPCTPVRLPRGRVPDLKEHVLKALQVLRAPNIGGHRKLFCRKTMLPFGSHQAPLYRVSRQPARGYPQSGASGTSFSPLGFNSPNIALRHALS